MQSLGFINKLLTNIITLIQLIQIFIIRLQIITKILIELINNRVLKFLIVQKVQVVQIVLVVQIILIDKEIQIVQTDQIVT